MSKTDHQTHFVTFPEGSTTACSRESNPTTSANFYPELTTDDKKLLTFNLFAHSSAKRPSSSVFKGALDYAPFGKKMFTIGKYLGKLGLAPFV